VTDDRRALQLQDRPVLCGERYDVHRAIVDVIALFCVEIARRVGSRA
jgi:hypothetical protein